MTNRKISRINIFPVKSLGGISLDQAVVEPRGLKFDRRWMLVDDKGSFLTQRSLPEMALLKVNFSEGELIVAHKVKEIEPLRIGIDSYMDEKLSVTVWDDTVWANLVSEKADMWFSSQLGRSCRLVYMPDDSLRKVDPKYAQSNEIVGFADAFPFLIIGEQSLEDLNSRLEEKLPMNRFRTNFVFSGGEAFEEDKWKSFRIGQTVFNAVKPCARCTVTTTNQDTAERGQEPLDTLAKYRNVNGKVIFGQNLTAQSFGGVISLGDEIEVIDWKQ